MRKLLLFLLVVALGLVVSHERGWIPPQHDPFAPLRLADPPGLATALKLSRLRGEGGACRAVLEAAELAFTAVPDRETGAFCGFEDVVRIEAAGAPLSSRVPVTCALAAALQLWGREVVQPAARRHLGSEVARIEHLGSYACRRVYGRSSGRPSQHATANALDVSAFRLEDGRRVTVLGGWQGPAEERAFLAEVQDGACALFRGVLGPDYNAAHRDHFHLDMGPYSLCR